MKTVELNNTSDNFEKIAIEVAEILNSSVYDDSIDFQADGENVIEYDNENEDSITWIIDSVYWNEDSTASRVELDC